MAQESQSPAAMIDDLLRFLPGFEEPGRASFAEWKTYYPVYDVDVAEFIKHASRPWWMDRNYLAHPAHEMLADDTFIQAASLDEIKTMLTFCARGERFSDGVWESMLKNGRIQSLLRRLQVLRAAMTA